MGTEMELGSSNPPRMEQALDVLERHLANRVYLVGQRFTLADISLSCSLSHFAPNLERATARWLGTCKAQDAFVAIAGKAAPAASVSKGAAVGSKPAAAQAAAQTATTPGATKATASAGPAPLVSNYSSCVGGRTQVKRIILAEDGGKSLIGQTLTVC